jgi:hypothetical protein
MIPMAATRDLHTACVFINTKVSVNIACKHDDKVEGGRARRN